MLFRWLLACFRVWCIRNAIRLSFSDSLFLVDFWRGQFERLLLTMSLYFLYRFRRVLPLRILKISIFKKKFNLALIRIFYLESSRASSAMKTREIWVLRLYFLYLLVCLPTRKMFETDQNPYCSWSSRLYLILTQTFRLF